MSASSRRRLELLKQAQYRVKHGVTQCPPGEAETLSLTFGRYRTPASHSRHILNAATKVATHPHDTETGEPVPIQFSSRHGR